ncbi:KdsC family phosphatase [Methylomagnum sp.]
MKSGWMPPDFAQRARQLKLVLTDCDGVLTDGGVYYSERGEALKRFNIRDGMGVERLRNLAGIETGIVTGEFSGSVSRRAEKLGIVECHLGAKDKRAVALSIMERLNLGSTEVAYLGDDVNDLPAFGVVGLTACPGDALDAVKAAADMILERPGGCGVFREFVEMVLKARGVGG